MNGTFWASPISATTTIANGVVFVATMNRLWVLGA